MKENLKCQGKKEGVSVKKRKDRLPHKVKGYTIPSAITFQFADGGFQYDKMTSNTTKLTS